MTSYENLVNTPFLFEHKPFGWMIQLGFIEVHYRGYYTLEVNGVGFDDMEEAPPRDRAPLARSALIMNMIGPKK